MKKSDKRQKEHGDESKFSTLALEWWQNQQNRWVEHHAQRVWQRLRDNSFSELDKKAIVEIEPLDVIQTVRIVENRGTLDVAKRVLQDISRVFRFGIQTGKLRKWDK